MSRKSSSPIKVEAPADQDSAPERIDWPADHVERTPLDKLIPYARNARMHSDAQVAQIAASIREFGWTMPILMDENGGVIAGHGRILAGRLLGLSEAPTMVARGWSDAKKRAYILADNKLALNATWDEEILSLEVQDLKSEGYDLSLTGFSTGELDQFLAFDPDVDDSGGHAPVVNLQPPQNPVSKRGDVWILGNHRLMNGDSTSHDDVRKLMNGRRAILFATDPPYLVDYDGNNHPTRNKDWSPTYGVTWDDSSQGAELYDGFIAAAIAEAIEPNAAWYCWHASRRQAMLEDCWERAGAFVHQQIIWVKDRGVLTRSHYLWKHEPCFMGWIKTNRPPKVAKETLPSTWDLVSFSGEDRPDQPTPKPLDAFGIPMRQHVERGGLCYEPFSGSGSQIMAGEENDRHVYAMEIGPPYVDVAIKRWQASTGREAVHEDGRTFRQVAQIAASRSRTRRMRDAPDSDSVAAIGARVAHIVNVSGGKDSAACYLLAVLRGRPFRAVMADTGHEHPDTMEFASRLHEQTGGPKVEFVRADFSAEFAAKRAIVETKWRAEGVPERIIDGALEVLHPTGNPMLDLCMLKSRFPSRRAQFCTEHLKRNVVNDQVIDPLLDAGPVAQWIGVRRDESAARKSAPFIQRVRIERGTMLLVRPIIHWTAENVFGFLAAHGVEPNPLYRRGMARVGCFPCINASKGEIRQIAIREPWALERLQHYERMVTAAGRRQTATFFAAKVTPEGAALARSVNARAHVLASLALPDERRDSPRFLAEVRRHVGLLSVDAPWPHAADVFEWARTTRGGRQFDLFEDPDEGLSCSSQYGLCE